MFYGKGQKCKNDSNLFSSSLEVIVYGELKSKFPNVWWTNANSTYKSEIENTVKKMHKIHLKHQVWNFDP